MQNENIYNLIAKEFSREISREEKLKLEHWLNESPENKKIYERLYTIWEKSVDTEIDFNPEIPKAIKRFKERIREIERKKQRRIIQHRVYRIAASIAILLGFTFYFMQLKQDTDLIEVVADNANTKLITLPDSSSIFLNKNTSVKYNEDFTERTIELDGEAFFEVRKQNGKPFIVKSNNTYTKVLGTSFNIKTSNENDCCDEISVLSGKVKFSSIDNGKYAILKPNQQAIYKSNSSEMEVKQVANTNFLAWKTGILKFENSTLEEILITLSDFYDVEYSVTSKEILEYKATCEFDNMTVADILKDLEMILPIRTNLDEKHIEIKFKN